jgi:hypothetical protein
LFLRLSRDWESQAIDMYCLAGGFVPLTLKNALIFCFFFQDLTPVPPEKQGAAL